MPLNNATNKSIYHGIFNKPINGSCAFNNSINKQYACNKFINDALDKLSNL